MFNFFKKRFTANATETAHPSIQPQGLAEKTREVIKLANGRVEEPIGLARATNFAGQEKAALAFILQSDSPEARFQAVMHIDSEEALAQVSRTLRNTDKRVSKLAREKLIKLQNQQKIDSAVQACLTQGEQLLGTLPLMVNQVSDWDKQRLALGDHGLSLLPTKEKLEHRLQAQLDLQRQTMEVIRKLRSIVEMDSALEPSKAQLTECQMQWQEIQSSPLSVSLPKSQFQQFTDELAKAQSHVEQLALAVSSPEVVAVAESDEEIKREKSGQKRAELKPEPGQVLSIDVEAVLVSLEQALQEGSLQHALDLDKSLRKAVIPDARAQRWNVLRSELNRLLDWARWSGNVSREELINVAENLSTAKLSASELAKQVGGLRSRWKELDRTSGAAAKTVWERFDGACNRAYQIADAYFKQQAQQRLENSSKAQVQLAAMDEVILTMQQQAPDWKAHQSYLNKVKLEWRKLGTMDRKLGAQLNAEFDQKIAALSQPLLAAREQAIGVRHQLIELVTAIAASGQATTREALEKVQQTQQRWQEEAQLLPLDHQDERKLWREFRAACDAVFARHKAKVEEQHQRRNQSILAKQACCEEVEQALEKSTEEIVQTLHRSKQTWRDLSRQAYGKHKPDELDARFDVALKKLEKRHAELVAEEKKKALDNLRAKIKLCRQIESTKESGDQNATWQSEWDSLGTKLLPGELNKLLTQRFKNALAGVNHSAANLAQVEELLLRIELLRGMPSPPELAQQRLQLQVGELKSALKHRDASSNYLSNFYTLCALPILLHEQQEQRFQTILNDYHF